LLSNTSIDLVLAERNLAALGAAGFSGGRLISAHNALMAALAGFTTQEFAPLPARPAAWQAMMRTRIEGIDAATYPAITAQLPGMANNAFVLRWQNGVTAPLDESFAFFVRTVIAGLAAMAQEQGT
jgi:hypothetical protein